MKVKFLKEWNTPEQFVAKGTITDRADAKALIEAGIAEAVKKGGK